MKQLLEQKEKLVALRNRIVEEQKHTATLLEADKAELEVTRKAQEEAKAKNDSISMNANRAKRELAEIVREEADAEEQLNALIRSECNLQQALSNLPGIAFGKKRVLKEQLDENREAIVSAKNRCAVLARKRAALETEMVLMDCSTVTAAQTDLDAKLTRLQAAVTQHNTNMERLEEAYIRVEAELTKVEASICDHRQKEAASAAENTVRNSAITDTSSKNTGASGEPDCSDRGGFGSVFAKLEALYPEHKVFALDSIDSSLREQLASMYRTQGYRTVEELLAANGFSLISGEEVRKIRSFVLYTPGTEPEVIRPKVQSMLQRLEQYYPDKVIFRGIQQDHKSLSQTISGLYQWLGYPDAGSMLEAYGYRYNVGASGRPENDYDAVIGALVDKYRDIPKPKNMGILLYDNPEFKSQLKTLQNKAPELFGMSLKKYFEELGLLEEKGTYAGAGATAKSGSSTMQDAAFAAMQDLYSKLDPAVYGTFEEAKACLSGCTVKRNKAGELYIFRAVSVPAHLQIPYGINFISDNAFEQQHELQSLQLPATLAKIGNSSFSGCWNLKEVTFAEGLLTIGNRAFEDCAVKEIDLPASLQTIGTFAFRGCALLTRVHMGNPLTLWEENVFSGTGWKPAQEEIEGDNNDFLYEIDRKNLVTITGYTGAASVLTIPRKLEGKPVVAIGKSAFEGNHGLVEVSMPDSITSLQNYAFRDCGNLEKVRLSNGIGRLYTSTFTGCTALKSVNLPDALTELKRGTLRENPLEKLHIGKGLQKIHSSLFYHGQYDSFTGEQTSCRSVGQITVDPANPNFSTDGRCVFSKDGTQLLAALDSLQDYRIPEGVRAIGTGAFEGLVTLTDITFPASLEQIEESAFSRTALRRVHFGGSIRTIGSSAFAYCQKLSSAVFDEGIETIERYAFTGCPLAAVSLPASVRNLGMECFPCFSVYDQNMRDFRISEDNPWLKADGSALYQLDGESKTLVAFYGHVYRQPVFDFWGNKPDSPTYVVAEGTTSIGPGAFQGCSNLGEVVLPYGLLQIGDQAFDGCSNLLAADIPETVTHIGAFAFRGCSIGEQRISASVREILGGAFAMGNEWEEAPSPLTEIHVDEENTHFTVQDNSLYRRGEAGMELITHFGDEAVVTISEGTTAIAPYAFYKSAAAQVRIPATVCRIGEKAFYRCMQLKRLLIELRVPEQGVKCATIYIPEVAADAFGFRNLSDRDQFLDCIRIDGEGTLFDFVKYDGLFDTISRTEDKILVATDRLKSAVGLIDHYRERYLRYLQSHADQAVKIVITHDDIDGLNTLAELAVFNLDNISRVIDLAVAAGRTDMAGFLMEHQNRNIGWSDNWEL